MTFLNRRWLREPSIIEAILSVVKHQSSFGRTWSGVYAFARPCSYLMMGGRFTQVALDLPKEAYP